MLWKMAGQARHDVREVVGVLVIPALSRNLPKNIIVICGGVSSYDLTFDNQIITKLLTVSGRKT